METPAKTPPLPDELAKEIYEDAPAATRAHYLKDINHLVTQDEARAMIERAHKSRDKFIIAFLYLTGARPVELTKVQAMDITVADDGMVQIKVNTAKKRHKEGFNLKTRILEFQKETPFLDVILSHSQAGNDKETYLCPISVIRIRQLVYLYSDNLFCPYHFRHSRLTALARSGAGMMELMYWKGGANMRSVEPYLANKPIGRRLVIT